MRKLIYEIYRKERHKRRVAIILNQQGYRTRTGKPFTDTTVERLIRDSTAKRRVEFALHYVPVQSLVNSQRQQSEAVTNAVKHAAARRIVAALEFTDRVLTVRIRDDGRGFDSAMAMKLSGMHFGLLGINERAQRIGGALELTSAAGNGTEIVVRVPIETPTVAV